MYRITYEQGNGYRCGCCRRTETYTHDVETEEEVLDWLEELYASCKLPIYEDEDDREVESIEKEIGKDISDILKPRKDRVEMKIKERQEILDERKKRKEDEERQREYKKYLKLKEKFKEE